MAKHINSFPLPQSADNNPIKPVRVAGGTYNIIYLATGTGISGNGRPIGVVQVRLAFDDVC